MSSKTKKGTTSKEKASLTEQKEENKSSDSKIQSRRGKMSSTVEKQKEKTTPTRSKFQENSLSTTSETIIYRTRSKDKIKIMEDEKTIKPKNMKNSTKDSNPLKTKSKSTNSSKNSSSIKRSKSVSSVKLSKNIKEQKSSRKKNEPIQNIKEISKNLPHRQRKDFIDILRAKSAPNESLKTLKKENQSKKKQKSKRELTSSKKSIKIIPKKSKKISQINICSLTHIKNLSKKFLYPPPKSNKCSGLKYSIHSKETETSTIEFESYRKLLDFWVEGQNVVFEDQTNVFKYLIISLFIDKIHYHYKSTPVLVITNYPEKWHIHLTKHSNIGESHILIYHDPPKPTKNEISFNNYFWDDCNKEFSILITSKENFISSSKRFPPWKWASIIVEEFKKDSIPISSVARNFENLTVCNFIFITQAFIELPYQSRNCFLNTNHSSTLPFAFEPTIKQNSSSSQRNIHSKQESAEIDNDIEFPLHFVQLTLQKAYDSQFFQEAIVYVYPTIQHSRSLCLFASENSDLFKLENFAQNETKIKFSSDYKAQLIHFMDITLLGCSHSELLHNESVQIIGQQSSKAVALLKILEKRSEKKTVVFCKDSATISIIITTLNECNNFIHNYTILDNILERKENKQKILEFNNDKDVPILISLSDLAPVCFSFIECSHVLIFDLSFLPWQYSPNILSWMSRSSPDATMERLLVKNSPEEEFFHVLWNSRKYHLSPIDLCLADFLNPESCTDEMLFLLMACLDQGYHEIINKIDLKRNIQNQLKNPKILHYNNFDEFPMPIFNAESFTANSKFDFVHAVPIIEDPNIIHLSPEKFWTEIRLTKFLNVLLNFGIGHSSAYTQFYREENEIQKLSLSIISICLQSQENLQEWTNLSTLQARLKLRDLNHFIKSISSFNTVLNKIDQIELLDVLELLFPLSSSSIKSADEISISNKFNTQSIPKEEFTSAEKELLFKVYNEGFCKHDSIKIRELLNRMSGKGEYVNRDKVIIKIKAPKRFSHEEHQKIITMLLGYGLPSIDRMISDISPNFAKKNHNVQNYKAEELQEYIYSLNEYCTAKTSSEKLSMLPLFGDKISRYATVKIPFRIALFTQIRYISTLIDLFAAEDIEFLTAIGFHGLSNVISSPILQNMFQGEATEMKIQLKFKWICQQYNLSELANQEHQGEYNLDYNELLAKSRVPKSIQIFPHAMLQKVPLKINDMMMLMCPGILKPNFYPDPLILTPEISHRYLYPEGYTISVQLPSVNGNNEWMICSISEKNDRPFFVVESQRTNQDDGYEQISFVGFSPDEVCEKYRKMLWEKGMRIPCFDGHEVFGLNCAFIHWIFQDMIENSDNRNNFPDYIRRWFRDNFVFSSSWPKIGVFSGNFGDKNLPKKQSGYLNLHMQPLIQRRKLANLEFSSPKLNAFNKVQIYKNLLDKEQRMIND